MGSRLKAHNYLMSTLSDIDTCRYIYLDQISEPVDNQLMLVISEAVIAQEQKPLNIGGLIIDNTQPIVTDAGCHQFHLQWSSYIAYSVRNESYTMADDYEEYRGRIAVFFHKSRYLDFVQASTFAGDEYPGRYKHWGFFCLNHIVDIVSMDEPTIQVEGV